MQRVLIRAENFLRDRSGNFAITTALLAPLLLVCAGGVVDLAGALAYKTELQETLDAAILAAAKETGNNAQLKTAGAMLLARQDVRDTLRIAGNSDGSITGTLEANFRTSFLPILNKGDIAISISSTAVAIKGASSGADCIYVLASQGQDVLINSGANVYSKACKVNVHSTASPAFIMNSGSKIDTAKFCVKGRNYIPNGGTITNLEVGCSPAGDPYAGKLPEPDVPSTCTTSGWKNDATVSMKPGVHCETGFNGSPTITFEPGLHVIKGRMIINSDATVVAKGVSFYFPDVNSEIRINGGITFTGMAPESGPYKGILMFEKTSNAANNANKQQYVFNGSKGETLEGIIYLPNRNVTYNSKTNQTNRISLVVNSVIMNSANWLIEPYDGGASGTGSSQAVRLVR